MSEEIWILLLVVAALLAIALAIKLIVWAFTGAIVILGFAGAQGVVGFAVYVACWIFVFPVMLTISIIVGLIAMRIEKQEERQREARARLGYHD